METADLFESNNPPDRGNAPGAGYLVTNQLNLMYMLAAGLMIPPTGFGDKYYRDTLECYPGWIPLFIDKVAKEAIGFSTKDARHLKPCIIEVNLSGLSGRVMALGSASLRELRFPEQSEGTDRVLLFPAPLPVSRIESVIFQSADDKRAVEADAKDFGNVPLVEFKRRSLKTLFTKASDIQWPPEQGSADRSTPLQVSFAAGGVMAMLLLFADLGEQAALACRGAFDPDDAAIPPACSLPILAGLESWIRDGVASLPESMDMETDRTGLQNTSQAKLFWEAIDRLAKWRDSPQTDTTENIIIEHLSAAITGLDPRLQADLQKLHDTLVSLTGLADATASELLDRHDTPLGRALTLFFLRRDCADLFDYESDRLAEPDWLAAAILFGVRDGWMNLPLRLRSSRDLSNAVSHRMAHLSHRIAGTGLELGESPPRVRPLRELFGDGAAWRSREKSAALELARAQKWDCVHTRINLGPGEYKLSVRGGSTQIELPGEPRITPEVDTSRFFDLLASARLDHHSAAKIRGMLQG